MILSILMSVFNGDATLDRAITSILEQTFSSFEFIICDDGSTDGTWEILQSFEKKDSRIILIKNECNIGLAASLNKCLAAAKGDYIARQDADDYSYANRIERTIDYIHKEGIPFAGCGVLIRDDVRIWSRRLYSENITRHDIVKAMPFFHPTMIFRREVLDAVHGYRVAKETQRTEDYDLTMRLAANNIYGRNLQDYLYEVYEPKDSYGIKHRRSTRWNEFRTRLYGYKQMMIPIWEYVYLIKPFIMCCVPIFMLSEIKRIQWNVIERKN